MPSPPFVSVASDADDDVWIRLLVLEPPRFFPMVLFGCWYSKSPPTFEPLRQKGLRRFVGMAMLERVASEQESSQRQISVRHKRQRREDDALLFFSTTMVACATEIRSVVRRHGTFYVAPTGNRIESIESNRIESNRIARSHFMNESMNPSLLYCSASKHRRGAKDLGTVYRTVELLPRLLMYGRYKLETPKTPRHTPGFFT